MSKSDITPPTPEAAKAIREELRKTQDDITDVRDLAALLRQGLDHLEEKQDASDRQRELLRGAVGSAVDRVSETPDVVRSVMVMELDRLRSDIAHDRREDAAAVRVLIIESEKRSATKIEAVDKRVDEHDSKLAELDLKLAASFAAVDREREEVTGVTRLHAQRLDKVEGFFAKHKEPIAASAGSTGLTLAVVHLAPLAWASLKAYAVSKGWTK